MTVVILPIYNQEKYLATALDSLVAQTDPDWIALCVDDGSTDATPRILSDYAVRDGRFRVLTKPNGGVSSARNAGLAALSRMPEVTHVAFLDPDDFYHPQCLEMVKAAVRQVPGAIIEWGYANEDLEGFKAQVFSADQVALRAPRLDSSVCNRLFPVETLEGLRFCEETAIAEDAAFLLELFHRHHPPCRHLPLELGFYCEHGSSNMHRELTEADFAERRAVVRRMLAVLADAPEERLDFCRDRLPGLLKRFYRDLERVAPNESDRAKGLFAGMLKELRTAGSLKPQRGSLKDLKYYLIFQMMSRRAR